jgi:death-on-curing protein
VKEPEWLSKALLLAVHDEQLAEHGGGTGARDSGVRDKGLLDAALARPRERFAFNESADLATLAASYTMGLVKNQPFVDGNKRTAFVAAEVFLEVNGMTLTASGGQCVLTMLRLAAGEIEEAAFAAWLRKNAVWQD